MLRRPSAIRQAFGSAAVGLPIAGVLGIAAFQSHAQEAIAPASAARSFSLVPTLALTETFTTNSRLTSADRQSELITQLSPGIHVSSNAGRIQGQLDYSLNGYIYSKNSSRSNFQNALNGVLKAEVVENWAFVDAKANISRQSISALGTQSPDPALQASNQSQVANWSVSPYLRGTLVDFADYEARVGYQALRSGSFDAANSSTRNASLSLGSAHASTARLGWGLDLAREDIDYSQGRATHSGRAVASLRLAATPEWQVSARGGRESNDFATADTKGTNTWGAGLEWRPSERTRVSVDRDKRFFGTSHSVALEYRTPRTVWRYNDSRDVTSAAGTSNGSTQTAYGLLYAIFASIEPDPTRRIQLVNATLASNGINAGSLVNGGFLTSAVTLQRRQEFSLALTGIRTTVLLNAYETQNSRLDPLVTASDDLSAGGIIRQRGLGATVSHRLTADASLVASVILLKSANDASAVTTDERSLTVTWSSRLGRHWNLSLSGRRVIFHAATTPYDESAVIAALDLVF